MKKRSSAKTLKRKSAQAHKLSSTWQHQFGAQPSDRGRSQREVSAIEVDELDHDRQPQPCAGLGLVEPAAAPADLLALLRGQARTIVIHDDADDAPLAVDLGPLHERFQRDARLRPFAGIVDEVADHLLEVLPLTAEARVLGRIKHNGDAAVVVDL